MGEHLLELLQTDFDVSQPFSTAQLTEVVACIQEAWNLVRDRILRDTSPPPIATDSRVRDGVHCEEGSDAANDDVDVQSGSTNTDVKNGKNEIHTTDTVMKYRDGDNCGVTWPQDIPEEEVGPWVSSTLKVVLGFAHTRRCCCCSGSISDYSVVDPIVSHPHDVAQHSEVRGNGALTASASSGITRRTKASYNEVTDIGIGDASRCTDLYLSAKVTVDGDTIVHNQADPLQVGIFNSEAVVTTCDKGAPVQQQRHASGVDTSLSHTSSDSSTDVNTKYSMNTISSCNNLRSTPATNCNSSSSTSTTCETQPDIGRAMASAEALLDYTWQKLNTGHWKDIAICWQYCYTWTTIGLASLLLSRLYCQLCHQQHSPPEAKHLWPDGETGSGLSSVSQQREQQDQTLPISREHQHETRLKISDVAWRVAKVVRAMDMGLLMGAPIPGSPLTEAASMLNSVARLSHSYEDRRGDGGGIAFSQPVEGKDISSFGQLVARPLETVFLPPVTSFYLSYVSPRIPVKLAGVIDGWPARGLWGVQYLRSVAGARTVPIEVGERYTDHEWSQELLTLDTFLTRYVESSSTSSSSPSSSSGRRAPGYLAQHQLLDQVPELLRDLSVPDYCHLGEEGGTEPRIHAWIGPRGTVSPLHHDPDHNILAQVVGYKYVRLYTEDQTAFLYPHDDPLLNNTSQVDVEDTAQHSLQFPDFKKATYADLILGPGDCVYIPPRCWHYIRSLSVSFSVSFWWT